MANKIPFDVRHKRVTTITGTEGIFVDVDGDDVPQRITVDDIKPIIAQDLQDVYDKSTSPEILTDSTRGALTVRRGSGADADTVIEVQNGAGTITASVTGGGTLTTTALVNNGTLVQGISRPAQITADQNNYATVGVSFLYLTSDAVRTITGFANGTPDGKILHVHNAGTFNILIANQSASSVAGNRVITGNAGATLTIPPNESVTFFKDVTVSNRWRILSKSF